MKTSLPRIVLSLALLVSAACGGKDTSPSTTPPGDGTGTAEQAGPDGSQSGADVVPATPLPGRGEPCSAEGDACAEGLECVTYYGIAGPKGPAFKSCETKCDAGQACPDGTSCQTVADGPGQVCR
jgi:hypothetical protein